MQDVVATIKNGGYNVSLTIERSGKRKVLSTSPGMPPASFLPILLKRMGLSLCRYKEIKKWLIKIRIHLMIFSLFHLNNSCYTLYIPFFYKTICLI